jgi:pSer/pThr/pTyr-binding forkhead associated (FHA) protein
MIVQLVVAAGNRTGQVIPVSVEKFIIGRAVDCHLKPSSELISRYHCAIHVGDEVTVRDLGSRNGVRLNGEKITAEQKLQNGDKLVIGPLEFYVRIASDENSLPESPAYGSVSSMVNNPDAPTISLARSKTFRQYDNGKSAVIGSDDETADGNR